RIVSPIWCRSRRIDAPAGTESIADVSGVIIPNLHAEATVPTMLKTLYRRVKRALQTPPPPVVSAVRRDALTYLDEAALKDLLHEVTTLEKMGRQGVLIEAGCALGGSAIVIASGKSKARPFYIYDVFGVIPPPGDND